MSSIKVFRSRPRSPAWNTAINAIEAIELIAGDTDNLRKKYQFNSRMSADDLCIMFIEIGADIGGEIQLICNKAVDTIVDFI